MPTQTETGKAFEYACAVALKDYQRGIDVVIKDTPQLRTASRCFELLETIEQQNYIDGAFSAVKIIDRLEPRLYNGGGRLFIGLQTDAAGMAGDVRDVLCVRSDRWEIGLSCKHNHEAVKHSRLSDRIDFGYEWFGVSCSHDYFQAVGSVFGPLRRMREDSLHDGRPALWSEIHDKEGTCYIPVLNAFIKELLRLDREHAGIPANLIRYLIGRNDFYKVIMNEGRRYTRIESININGTLNLPCGSKRPLVDVPIMRLPTKFYEVGFKEDSSNTINVICDNGWNISMRIHNASSKVEPSLKFDVQLLAMPSSILTQIEPWD